MGSMAQTVLNVDIVRRTRSVTMRQENVLANVTVAGKGKDVTEVKY